MDCEMTGDIVIDDHTPFEKMIDSRLTDDQQVKQLTKVFEEAKKTRTTLHS
eukprot:TRINITY_DN11663_c0_g1_i1.p2 TRINITY_DN11663_c0_g1~~TRINITY_DN11663_c0_g1_i1.p2  ORF type:complete len:51 (-),score=10.63 TRINITY_DN11663_c0_g1_i1:28-180(-)